MGFINHLITGGPHLVDLWVSGLGRNSEREFLEIHVKTCNTNRVSCGSFMFVSIELASFFPRCHTSLNVLGHPGTDSNSSELWPKLGLTVDLIDLSLSAILAMSICWVAVHIVYSLFVDIPFLFEYILTFWCLPFFLVLNPPNSLGEHPNFGGQRPLLLYLLMNKWPSPILFLWLESPNLNG